MKEKIKKIISWLFRRWVKIAEIVVVIWAVNGMHKAISFNADMLTLKENEALLMAVNMGMNLPLVIALFYFLSAVLILYLLRRYERKN